MRLLLPLLLVNITVGNNLWKLGPIFWGQVLFWMMIAAVLLILLLSFRGSTWLWIAVGVVLTARVAGANLATGLMYLLYIVPLYGMFLVAGAVTAAERSDRVYRQLRLYFLLSLPLMILQVAGAGDWTLALNTESMGGGETILEAPLKVSPTLFVPATQVRHAIGQGRPAGFMHANNILSLAIIFGLALQLGRIRSARVTWSDALFCSIFVLAMAKIAILSVAVMLAWLFVTGSAVVRRRVTKVFALIGLLYATYYSFFPGVMAVELSSYRLQYSIFVRLNDIVETLNPQGGMRQFLEGELSGTQRIIYQDPNDIGLLSGYALLLAALPYVVPLGLVAFLLFRNGLGAVRERSATSAQVATLLLFGLALFPAAVPIWRAPLYWFMAGFALLPALASLSPGLGASIVDPPLGGVWGRPEMPDAGSTSLRGLHEEKGFTNPQ